MALIRRRWTPADADEWTKEDWFSIVLSPLAYIGLAVGVALSVLLLKIGFIVLGVAVVLTALMHWVIDPKLRVISEDYEKKQKHYLEELEKIERWEEIQ
jgi:ABC-type bacteriocin/lantibiotic exporter with double-glycine peptidase domain